jgi:hypothetical protein
VELAAMVSDHDDVEGQQDEDGDEVFITPY